jgi:O-antigen biosynthesis protein
MMGPRTLIREIGFRLWPSPLACPVCERELRRFDRLPDMYEEEARKHGFPLPISGAETLNRAAYSCTRCGASDRDRLCALFLRENRTSETNPRPRLVHFAPARALDQCVRRLGYEVRTTDLFMDGVDDRLNIEHLDAYPEGSFDGLICSHVLEHVPNDRQAMRELFRILRPGGWGIVLVPLNLSVEKTDEDPSVTDVHERWRRFGQDDHIRLYARRDFIARLKEPGFVVEELGIAHFGEHAFRINAIAPGSILYVARKPGTGRV